MPDVDEWNRLRALFLADQRAGAQREAADYVAGKAGGAEHVAKDWTPSPWVLALLAESRRNRCSHWPREGAALVFVVAHVRQMQCRSCAARSLASLAGSLDERRCDLCRDEADLAPFAFHAGSTLVVTGRCCAGCLAVVIGAAE